ncbi:hypothetical protein GOP47_0020477 [Adiantum capillus-veneris]|uniref:Uncharacterized protein n=1 Tax=Adiantum capillus-veneris TaxID=13818 RepID=A0A9D4UA23_ADICA|nr:hypothetical protein GOP47_0020477 [Adiantum capillus-veneris]
MRLRGFVEGGLASIVAGCSTHPLDVIKVRVQLEGAGGAALQLAHASGRSSAIEMGLRLVQTEGMQGLFCGVSATILRQMLYSTTRMGVYHLLKQQLLMQAQPAINSATHALVQDAGLPFCKKVAAGLIAGGVGAIVGNPADVALVRMQADGLLPVEERRNYRGVVDALARMVKQEGLQSLWTGSYLTVQRAMVVTACQLAAYDQMKESLVRSGMVRSGVAVCVIASVCAGVAASVVCTPIDVVRTRMMNNTPRGRGRGRGRGKGTYYYSSPLDCALQTVRQEGGLALYKGFLPTLTRQGPFTVVLFLTLEQIRRLQLKLGV